MATRTSRPDGAVHLSDVKVEELYLDPGYKLELHEARRGQTGLLQVFSLIPDDPQRPSFAARIDDGVPGRRSTPRLDIDIKGVTVEVERDFKANRNGYAGHHTDGSLTETERAFDVKVSVPSGTIFEGRVSVKANFVMLAGAGPFSFRGGDANLTHVRKPASER